LFTVLYSSILGKQTIKNLQWIKKDEMNTRKNYYIFVLFSSKKKTFILEAKLLDDTFFRKEAPRCSVSLCLKQEKLSVNEIRKINIIQLFCAHFSFSSKCILILKK